MRTRSQSALALILLPVLFEAASAARADDATTPIAILVPRHPGPVSYAREIATILETKCVGCHGDTLAEHQLNLEEVEGMLKGGRRGPALVSGKADESLLFQLAAH